MNCATILKYISSMSKPLVLKASDLPSKDRKFVLSNHAYLHPDDFTVLFPGKKSEDNSAHLLVKNFVYAAE